VRRRFAFAFSPWGNGFECFRTWEMLLFGTIPIILEYGRAAELYRHHPVVVVKSFDEITEENLAIWEKRLRPLVEDREYVGWLLSSLPVLTLMGRREEDSELAD
jgi:hypothetical protein